MSRILWFKSYARESECLFMKMEEVTKFNGSLREECITHFNLAKNSCSYVDLSKEECNIISNFATAAAKAVMTEEKQKQINETTYKRFYTAFLGKYAVAKYLGCPYKFKGDFPGGSYTNKIDELSFLGYKIGIKCSHVGRTIKINFNNKYIQLICQYKELSEAGLDYEKHYTRVYIMGFLKPEDISKFCKKEYIEEESVRNRGTKGGFFEFEKLTPFSLAILEDNKYSVKVNNFIYKELTEDIVNIVKKSCNFMEKLKGYDLGLIPFSETENGSLDFTFNTDFQKETLEEQEKVLETLSQKIVVGFGVSGYLHKLQGCYVGNKEYDIKYIELNDVIAMHNFEDSVEVACEWINRLYSWVDYYKKYTDVQKSYDENWYSWHHKLTISFLEYIQSNVGITCVITK